MSLITPTFGDKSKAEISPQGDTGAGPPQTRIVEQHEPLSVDPWAGLKGVSQPGAMQAISPPTQQVAPVAQPNDLKIALIGTAPSSRLLAPFNDPTWTIWGCSPGNMGTLPRFDAWVEIHANLTWPQYKHYGEPYIAWLKTLKVPVYMQDQSLVPSAITFPKDKLVAEFGPYFFTSSFAWMMAMAITMGAKEIALYGIDMASHDEYIIQRPGAYYFFIEGAKRGIKIWAPYESDILQPPGLYGYSDIAPFGRKMLAREDELTQRIVPIEQQHAKLTQDLFYLRGAKENQQYLREIWFGAGETHSGERYLDQLLEKTKSPEHRS